MQDSSYAGSMAAGGAILEKYSVLLLVVLFVESKLTIDKTTLFLQNKPVA